ncbi:hypothetical protein [Spiroplasma alleghenense]|uniref:hypothetical protein n=1 Tax=Spiroplasma alleghenense TaxID=216931 RepID=UPI000E1F15C2|nr:hypothetical protein [Spiroplasma alleghenense]
MEEKLNNQTEFLFIFCKKCWNYQKFLFNDKLSEDKNHLKVFNCGVCERQQKIDIKAIHQYYEVLNEHNN